METIHDTLPAMRANNAKGNKGKAQGSKATRASVSDARTSSHSAPVITRVLAYRRVSTLEQGRQGNSLELQREEILRYCEYAKLPDPIDFEETESGSAEAQERREQVASLLKQVRRGDLVLVSKIDRFSRDIVFTITAVREIIKRGARFLSISEHFDPSTPEGETQMALWASIAQMERARIRERTEGNRKKLRAMGYFVEGNPPFGYVRATGEHPGEKPRRLEIDKDKAKVIREMFDLCVAGKSAKRISRILTEKYPEIRKYPSEWILKALKNRIYAGQLALTSVRPREYTSTIKRPAEWRDTHEPIVSLETWMMAQDALKGRRSYGANPDDESRTAHWIMRGIARCAICGFIVATCPNRDTTRRSHPGYYACNRRLRSTTGEKCTLPYRRQPETDEFVINETEKHFTIICAELLHKPTAIHHPETDEFERKRAELIAARERLVGLVMSGTWSMEVIDRRAKQIEADLVSLAIAERQMTIEETDDTIQNRNGARQWIEKIAARWSRLNVTKRRAVIAAMIDQIVIGIDKISMQWASPSTMATRYAKGALVNIDGEIIETRRSRPRQTEAGDVGKGLDPVSCDPDDDE